MTTHDAPSGPAEPGEGSGTGAGDREAQNGAQGALDAAIEAATIAIHDLDCKSDCRESPTTMAFWARPAQAAVRAAEPILRQAVAEEIARRIEDVCECAGDKAEDCEYRDAAEIAREVGRGE